DTTETFFTDQVLKDADIIVREGFKKENITKEIQLIIHSTAYNPKTHPEITEAQERGVPTMSYPQAVGEISKNFFTIAVAGTHGKTTTTAIIGSILKTANLDPSAIVGSRVNDWKGNALNGKGKYFVLEADEYQNKLKYYHPTFVVLTNVDWDHPDFFPTRESYEKVFADFLSRVPQYGCIVVCADDADAERIVRKSAHARVITYGYDQSSDIVIKRNQQQERENGATFSLNTKQKKPEIFQTKLYGKHNTQNMTAAIIVARELGAKEESIQKAVAEFHGTARRFEKMGEKNGVTVFDDYAHHPTEIKATITAAREVCKDQKMVIVFHPHTFSRTQALMEEFSQSFDGADRVIILPIYASAREEGQNQTVSSQDLAMRINQYSKDKAVTVDTMDEAVTLIEKTTIENDVIITMGAGDVWRVGKMFLAKK
ncbi:MAG: UDP-N-acetylmuramate--L-alanine ligase, partial [Candidatus Moranbacteria bacterium]|nr:UDP-N-acetylmuramate--L-alanine ligase [Candidatus Moranbacteria bacterium]